jgi:hypothetical protein
MSQLNIEIRRPGFAIAGFYIAGVTLEAGLAFEQTRKDFPLYGALSRAVDQSLAYGCRQTPLLLTPFQHSQNRMRNDALFPGGNGS